MKIKMLECEHLAGASQSALHFVCDQKDSVLSRYVFQPRKKLWRRNDVAAFALNGFNNDGCNFGRVHGCLENNIFQVVALSIRHVRYAWHQRSESLSLDRLG